MYLSNLKNSLINADIFIDKCINLKKIDDEWLNTLIFLSTTTETSIGIYEQFLSIIHSISKLKNKKFFIIKTQ